MLEIRRTQKRPVVRSRTRAGLWILTAVDHFATTADPKAEACREEREPSFLKRPARAFHERWPSDDALEEQ